MYTISMGELLLNLVEDLCEEKREAVFSPEEEKKLNCYRKIPSHRWCSGKCEINLKFLGKAILAGFSSIHKEKNYAYKKVNYCMFRTYCE